MKPDPLDIIAYFDPLDRIEGAVMTFVHADWRRAWRKRGLWGVLVEFVRCVLSLNNPTIRWKRNQGWSGVDVERLLKRHGVVVWDRGFTGDELWCCVKARQVKWAQYVMHRAGVPITGRQHEMRNATWAARHPAGDEPAKHSKWRVRR